ncbi:MAG: glycosyltransferase family 2 protein [Actinobacteria bacterium]|nr:glycosyltransferase family 2 protein [Actinomycetota bacterium]
MSRLTIVIPTYNRPGFLGECLESLMAQTFSDFRLVILDNASETDYGPVLERFSSAGIEYIRNAENIGSTRNIEKAFAIGSATEYFTIFHDDDLAHPYMLEQQVRTLDANPGMRWVATECAPFVSGSAVAFEDVGIGALDIYQTPPALVRRLLENVALNFGSVMFHSSQGPPARLRHAEFEIVADRVLLVDLAQSGPVGLLREPLVRYRHHEGQDSHNPIFREAHALALMRYYRDALGAPLAAEDLRLLRRHATNYLLHARTAVLPDARIAFGELVDAAKRDGVFSWAAIDGQGIAALAALAGVGSAYSAVRPLLGKIKRALSRR